MKRVDIIKIVLGVFFLTAITSHAQRKMEDLDRGLVAVKKGTGVYLSWRIPGTELRNVAYNIYRDGTKINEDPISGSSNYTDNTGTIGNRYAVRAIDNGIEQTASDEATVWSSQYFDIPVQAINDSWSTYNINDASVGDLDGDGEYEIVVKRLPNNGEPESTDYNMLEAYKLDGTFMWRINLGPNINNAVETNFLVYDFDEDGKAEIITRTSDGMIDGTGTNIGDRDNDGKINYRYSFYKNSDYYRTEGPDYISVFEGETGKELAWDMYIERDPIVQWGSAGMNLAQLGHRATKCMWTVAYLDGKHPSFVNSRGIYHRTKLEGWDWDGTNLTKRWTFDSGGSGAYYGQGNHQLSCADVDDDGRDEVVYGSMTVDDDGTGLYSAKTGHGDAMHVSDMVPDRPGLEIWDCLEGSRDWGATLRDAATGQILIRYRSNRDCGRCAAGDISPDNKGYEFWAATECPMYNTKGQVIGSNNVPQNFMIWWDGDLSREFLTDANFSSEIGYGIPDISKYDSEVKDNITIFRANGTATNNWTKGTPCLQADIIGDWREEILVRTPDNKTMRLYTTTTPTEVRVPTLMNEPQYRIAISWQNNSYNQPPHTGIYLGSETKDVPPYPMSNGEIIWEQGASWDSSSSNWSDEDGTMQTFSDGDKVLFDYTGDNGSAINISETLSPKRVRVQSHMDYVFSGNGKLSGNMELLKAGTGTMTMSNQQNDYTGETVVYYGRLNLESNLSASHVSVCMFGSLYTNATLGGGFTVRPDGEFNIGMAENEAVSLMVGDSINFEEDAIIYFDLSDDPEGTAKDNDQITLTGDINVKGKCHFIFNRLDGILSSGSYALITFDGEFSGNVEDILIENIPDVACSISAEDGKLMLNVLAVRTATELTWSGSESNVWDHTGAKNWLNGGESDWFVTDDRVTFDDTGASQNNINITEDVPVGSVTVEGGTNYTFNGERGIAGTGGLTKNGDGKLFINTINSYTGPTVLRGGMTEISSLKNAGMNSPLGAASADSSNLVINGAMLRISGTSSSSDRDMTIDTGNGTLYIDYGNTVSLSGSVYGEGMLTKDGPGTLSLSSANYYRGGTSINDGNVKLASEEATISGLGSGMVTLKNATLSMFNNTGSSTVINWDMNVPAGFSATLNLDGRCTWNGALTGSGELNIYTPYIRSELNGDWTGFNGTIRVSTDDNGGSFIMGNSNGYKNSSIHLDEKVKAIYAKSEDAVIEIGELTGVSSSSLGAGGSETNTITWKIGGKNTNFTFDGRINNDQFSGSGAEAAIIKTGSGRWTITNANTYSGGTTVEKGAVLAENVSGSATGTGDVVVQSGALLGGSGFISGNVFVQGNGYLSPGNAEDIDVLYIDKNLEINSGGYIVAKTDAETNSADITLVKGSVVLDNARLYLNKINGTYAPGNHFKVLQCTTISGTVSGVIPTSPGEGLYWDLSLIHSGIVQVTNTLPIETKTIHSLKIFPNPAEGMVSIDLSGINETGQISVETLTGKMILQQHITGGKIMELNIEDLVNGIYLVKINTGQKIYTEKLMIR